MTIKVACGCEKVYVVPAGKAGKKLRCGKCQALLVVPTATGTPGSQREAADVESDPFAGLPDVESTEERLPARTVTRRTKSRNSEPTSATLSAPSLYGNSLEERMEARAQQSEPGHRRGRAIKYIGGGLFLLAVAALVFWYFSHLEERGGFVRIHFVVALLYKLGGKWLAALVIAGIGAISCLLGLLNLLGFAVDVETDD